MKKKSYENLDVFAFIYLHYSSLIIHNYLRQDSKKTFKQPCLHCKYLLTFTLYYIKISIVCG